MEVNTEWFTKQKSLFLFFEYLPTLNELHIDNSFVITAALFLARKFHATTDVDDITYGNKKTPSMRTTTYQPIDYFLVDYRWWRVKCLLHHGWKQSSISQTKDSKSFLSFLMM